MICVVTPMVVIRSIMKLKRYKIPTSLEVGGVHQQFYHPRSKKGREKQQNVVSSITKIPHKMATVFDLSVT